jgi:hypothetical protein
MTQTVTTVSTVALKDMTVVRANVIAERTGSLEMGIAKALLIEQLKEKMANGVAHFIFKKKDGSLREMFATTCKPLIEKHVNGRGVSRECYATTAVFCVESGAWRSFRWESIIKVF